MSYWSNLFDEVRRRRRNLARAITPLRASFLEFLVFAAVLLALTGPIFLSQKWDFRGPAIVVGGFIAAYLIADSRRQKRAAEGPKRRDDIIALSLFLALPFAALTAAWASRQPAEVSGPLAIPETPSKAITATIVP